MAELFDQIQEAAAFIGSRWKGRAEVGMILGTGLGRLGREIKSDLELPYRGIPHFPESTVESHAGRLNIGELAGRKVIAMEGRFHAYEGYSATQITFPVHVMKSLGCHTLVVSNACGGMNPQYRAGDIMVIEDHINLMGVNPLIGRNDDRIGPRFPDMSAPYDRRLIDSALKVALDSGIRAHQGIYVGVVGPNLETRAEYRFLRQIGADVVGMSTVPEALTAAHIGLKTLGLSVVTDMCLPDALEPAELHKILKIAGEAEPKLCAIVKGVLAAM